MRTIKYIAGLSWYTVKLLAVIHTFGIACALSDRGTIDYIALGSMVMCTCLALSNTKVNK